MTCEICGGAVEMTESHGGTDFGDDFREEYRCVECDARGTVRGTVGEAPRNYERTGRLFWEES